MIRVLIACLTLAGVIVSPAFAAPEAAKAEAKPEPVLKVGEMFPDRHRARPRRAPS